LSQTIDIVNKTNAPQTFHPSNRNVTSQSICDDGNVVHLLGRHVLPGKRSVGRPEGLGVAPRQRQQTRSVQHLHDALHFDLRESMKRHGEVECELNGLLAVCMRFFLAIATYQKKE
jgi:hypothetical protein